MSTQSPTSAEIAAIFKKLDRLLYSDNEQNKALPHQFRSEIMGGIECDALPNAHGEFGRSLSNPIPANGPIGEVLYLSRLRTNAGHPIMFHRIGSDQGAKGSVDVYEVLSLDGSVPEFIFMSMYHPRKSNLVPMGYIRAVEFDPSNITYGVNHNVVNFPQKLDVHIRNWQIQIIGLPLPVGRVREAIGRSHFSSAAPKEGPSESIVPVVKAAHSARGKLGLLREINNCLSAYIRVHDEIFKFSLRKILPGPFFKAINFKAFGQVLAKVEGRLGITLEGWGKFSLQEVKPAVLYTVRLLEAVILLREICVRLGEKSDGREYRHKEYSADCSRYKLAVEGYLAHAKTINALAAKWSVEERREG